MVRGRRARVQRRHNGGRRDLGEGGAGGNGKKDWRLMGSFGGIGDREEAKCRDGSVIQQWSYGRDPACSGTRNGPAARSP